VLKRKIAGERPNATARYAVCGLAAILSACVLTAAARAGQWPQWGRDNSRNMVSDETGLPRSFSPGRKDSRGDGIDPSTTKNVLWSAKVGLATYSTPAVTGGKVYIGTCIDGMGTLKCLDARNGELLWQWAAPAREVPAVLAGGRFCFCNHPRKLGLTSTPTVEGDRVYFVSHRCEVVCLDAGSITQCQRATAPATGQTPSGAADRSPSLDVGSPRVVWSYDMYEEVGTRPADACHGNVLIDGDLLYAGTSNGVDRYAQAREQGELRKPPAPTAPSLIVLDKKTGRLVASDDARIGPRLLHGQWSSPSLGAVNGRKLVFFGGGDGTCYAFEALSAVPDQPVKLKTVWTFDCNPPEYKQFGGMDPIEHFARGDIRRSDTINGNDGTFLGLNAFIASPVFYKDRVYVPIGQDPEHGRGRGALWCIDAAKTGDITGSGRIWCYRGLDRSLSTVSIANGLVYAADVAGRLHCLDAETGQCHWVHETGAVVWASTLVVDGKVYLPTVKALWMLAAGKEKKVLHQVNLGAPSWASPVAADGTLYVTSRSYLWAVRR
jgi:outer membrane protein assembly factor BamB